MTKRKDPITHKKSGRPPGKGKATGINSKLYSDGVAKTICDGLSQGIPLTQLVEKHGLASITTIHGWMSSVPNFADRVAHARQLGFERMAEDCLKIADETEEGEETTEEDDGKIKRTRKDMLHHRKLRIETRLKLLACWDPKRYGQKIAQEVSGPDGGPVQIDATLSPSEAYKRMIGK